MPASTCGHDELLRRDDRKHLQLRRADLDGHRRRDDRGSHLRGLHLRELHLEHPVRRHHGNHRHLRHLDDHLEHRRAGHRDDLPLGSDVPNGSALHRGWDEEASNPG